MESSPSLGCTEECSGTSGIESGWTTYIGSPFQENHHYRHYRRDDDDDSFRKPEDYETANYRNDDSDGSESDDSMASDASSGPTRLEFPFKSNERSVGMGPFKHTTTKYSSRRKLHKQIKQIEVVRPRIKIENEVSVLEAKSAASHVHCGTKVRKAK